MFATSIRSTVARWATIAALFFATASGAMAQQPAEQVTSNLFNIKQVVPGVWALLVKQGTALAVSNAAVIELGDKVIVVDSHLTPSAAREASRIIAALTGNKPVRYLINTHWHPDHVQGNSTYSSAFPGAIDIISHTNTRRDIIALEVPFIQQQRKTTLPNQIAQMKGQLSAGVVDGKPMTDAQKTQLQNRIRNTETLLSELQNLEITLPTLTLDRSMSLYTGEREVRVLYFGRGHTEGDVVVFLPKEKVLVTGDLLTNSIPLMRDAYPIEWSATLAGVETLDYTQNIPGHGDVQQGKERLLMLRAFLDDLIPAVRRAIAEGKTVDEAKRTVKAELAPRHEKNFPSWNGAAEASIERAYTHLKGNRI
jgi:glyoxylase-like metal-dependent hydrolase (beta-lactamase superfamily II)